LTRGSFRQIQNNLQIETRDRPSRRRRPIVQHKIKIKKEKHNNKKKKQKQTLSSATVVSTLKDDNEESEAIRLSIFNVPTKK
jgi:hypothetical protein